jgi:hypothetical protein
MEEMTKTKQYEMLTKLERSTSQMRYTTFTALISISFILPGFAAQTSRTAIPIHFLGQTTSPPALAFLLGLFFYIFTVVHYVWYHRYSHIYRHKLKQLEEELNIEVYRLRVRPTLGRMKFHFNWLLYILGIAYFAVTIVFVGWLLTILPLIIAVLIYLGLLIWSIRWDMEPLEHIGHVVEVSTPEQTSSSQQL